MKTYTAIIVTCLAAVVAPCIALTIMRRPRPFRYVLRGGEAAVCLAFAVDTVRRLVLISSGVPVSYPGDFWAIANVLMLSASGMLLWGRVAQLIRHDLRARDARNQMVLAARTNGIEVDQILKQTRKPKGD